MTGDRGSCAAQRAARLHQDRGQGQGVTSPGPLPVARASGGRAPEASIRQTLAPAGSTRGGSGGDEWSEALREKALKGGQRTVRAATRVNTEQASKESMWEPTRHTNGEGRRRRRSERDLQPAIPPG